MVFNDILINLGLLCLIYKFTQFLDQHLIFDLEMLKLLLKRKTKVMYYLHLYIMHFGFFYL